MERATCWSITINNPEPKEYKCQLPANWALTGQEEIGEEGTVHYQGCLTTPQVRFSAVKKIFPRAHIEVARNKKALQKYVHKTDTRIQEVPDNVSNIPTLFDYQHTIAKRWDDDEFNKLDKKWRLEDPKKCSGDIALDYVDTLVAQDIESGHIGVEYIAINPMWRSAWKKFWKSMVARERKIISTEEVYNGEVCEQEDGSILQEESPRPAFESPITCEPCFSSDSTEIYHENEMG